MDEQKLTHKPHVGPKPVEAKPNRGWEKTYEATNPPKEAAEEDRKSPDGKAREKTSDEMSDATNEVIKRL